jgi:cytosine/adenosine deaminase-related metal-dependent hydrolase
MTLTTSMPREPQNPSRGRLTAGATADFVSVDAQLQALLDVVRDALHDALARALASDVDASVVGVAHESMPALVKLPVEVVEHDV